MTKAEIQSVRALADKRERDAQGLFVAEGDKLVGELLGSHLQVHRLYVTEASALAGHPVAEHVTDKEMERLSQLKTANRSLAVVGKPSHALAAVDAAKNLVLALDCVQNPGNLGTIIRLADWFGIGDIVCSADSADCYNEKVVQATMGAIMRVRVHYTDLPAWLAAQRKAGAQVYGTFLDGDNIYDTSLTPNGIIVMGNEGRGICSECGRHISHRLFIPPYPADRAGSESLNVAIATAVVCSEFRRR